MAGHVTELVAASWIANPWGRALRGTGRGAARRAAGRRRAGREPVGRALAEHGPEPAARLAVTRSGRGDLSERGDGRERRAEDQEETEDTGGAGHETSPWGNRPGRAPPTPPRR